MVKDYLDSWEVADKIIACGFNTTSSNTGVNNGSCTILQNLLHQQLLWLACRHHILELIIGGAFTTIFGVTSGPEVTTFKILKTSWNSLNLGDRRLPDIPSYFKDPEDVLEQSKPWRQTATRHPLLLQRRRRGHLGVRQQQTRSRVSPTPRRLQGTAGAGEVDPWWRYRAEEGLQLHHTTPWC